MKTFSCIDDFQCDKKVVVTLGTFDGLHLGHQKIINDLVTSAKKLEVESLVLTFFPHPRMVLQKEHGIRLLSTLAEKTLLLENLGLENLVVQKFDQEFSQLTAGEFVKNVLVEKFNVAKVIIGYDHRFGKGGTGNIDDLRVYGKQYGFEVQEISAKEMDKVSISSTKIRQALESGEVSLANSYLGYPYFFSGKVVKGKALGRQIGFPTANFQILEDYKLIPKNGVYIVESLIDNKVVKGMMSIGINPTFEKHPYSIEVNYLDLNLDLYDRIIRVNILKRIRDEEKFDGLPNLIAQLKEDERTTREFFNNRM
ncbi:bifunctional riboflavin kinase/FAD synthetase [Myroides sp. LJL119]